MNVSIDHYISAPVGAIAGDDHGASFRCCECSRLGSLGSIPESLELPAATEAAYELAATVADAPTDFVDNVAQLGVNSTAPDYVLAPDSASARPHRPRRLPKAARARQNAGPVAAMLHHWGSGRAA